MADCHTTPPCLDSEGLTRRSVIAALPAAMATAGLPALAVPVISESAKMFAEWQAARERVLASMLDDVDDPNWHEMMRIEEDLIAIPVRTPADLARKLYAYTSGEVVGLFPQSNPVTMEILALALGGAA